MKKKEPGQREDGPAAPTFFVSCFSNGDDPTAKLLRINAVPHTNTHTINGHHKLPERQPGTQAPLARHMLPVQCQLKP